MFIINHTLNNHHHLSSSKVTYSNSKMLKIDLLRASLLLVACGLVAHGLERNMQEVLEERYKQLATDARQEPGSLPQINSEPPKKQTPEMNEGTSQIEAETPSPLNQCKCAQDTVAPQEQPKPVRAEPVVACAVVEPVKEAPKEEEKVIVACAPKQPEIKAEVRKCEEQVEVVSEKLEGDVVEATKAQEVQVEAEQAEEEEVVAPKEVKKQKKGKGKSKRDKRDTKAVKSNGKNKNKSASKSKSKRSADGKSKDGGKRKDNKKGGSKGEKSRK